MKFKAGDIVKIVGGDTVDMGLGIELTITESMKKWIGVNTKVRETLDDGTCLLSVDDCWYQWSENWLELVESQDESQDESLPSSGNIETYGEDGALRDNPQGKGRFDLVPFEAIARIAVHYENGAKKYDDDNWKKGQPISRGLDAALRHLGKYQAGYNDEDHLGAAAWNIFMMMYFESEKPELQDLVERQDIDNQKFIYRNTNK